MRGQPIVYQPLNRLGVAYEAMEHEPVYTVEEMDRLTFPPDVDFAKNLFLRDSKGKRHFLVVLPKDKKVDLRSLRERLGTTQLSFASEDRLAKYLGLTKGSVTPFGVLNDAALAVEVVFDKGLEAYGRVGVHPNDNSATLFLALPDIVRVVEEHGNAVISIEL
jgi:Ala-tRNA(Pro) deacylase